VEFFQVSNDMLHQDTGFFNEMMKQFLKQSDCVIPRSTLRFADFIIWKTIFSTFITSITGDYPQFFNERKALLKRGKFGL